MQIRKLDAHNALLKKVQGTLRITVNLPREIFQENPRILGPLESAPRMLRDEVRGIHRREAQFPIVRSIMIRDEGSRDPQRCMYLNPEHVSQLVVVGFFHVYAEISSLATKESSTCLVFHSSRTAGVS